MHHMTQYCMINILFFTADMTSDTSQINSFVLSNMAPQHRKHNRIAWKNWEAYTQKKTMDKKVLFVITGVTGDGEKFVYALYLSFSYFFIGVCYLQHEKITSYNTSTLLQTSCVV